MKDIIKGGIVAAAGIVVGSMTTFLFSRKKIKALTHERDESRAEADKMGEKIFELKSESKGGHSPMVVSEPAEIHAPPQ